MFRSNLLDFPLNDLFENINRKVAMYSYHTDLIERENEFELRMNLPGYTKEMIDISIDNDILYIKGNKDDSVNNSDEKFIFRERKNNSFVREFLLSKNVNKEDIKASYENGVLILKIGKLAKQDAIKIKIE